MRPLADALKACLLCRLPFASQRAAAPAVARLSGSSSSGDDGISRIAQKLGSSRVVVMVGAGVSVSAGIPDFRTPGTGLYDNLQEYGLPYAEAIFDLDFFRRNPKPFYRLCKELWPGNFRPTAAHLFIRLLHEKGCLFRCFSQNIDSLETAAGLPKSALVAAHGNFDSASVGALGGRPVPIDECKAAAFGGEGAWEALNKKHGGQVKPDIVFFGEQLPSRFLQCIQTDLPMCDTLIVMGTSLAVQPFASLVGMVPAGATRVLINRERVGEASSLRGGFHFEADGASDFFLQGNCDDVVHRLVDAAGWRDEFDALANEVQAPEV